MPSKHDTRHKDIGGRHRAATRYALIKHRITNTHTTKNACYSGVQLRVEREDFIAWFRPKDFEGCSIDRLDRLGHYELSNMQVIPLAANIAKEKLIASGGTTVCSRCDKIKALSDFVKSRRISTGRATTCKDCDNARKRVIDGPGRWPKDRSTGQ